MTAPDMAMVVIVALIATPALILAATFRAQPAPQPDQDQGDADVRGERGGFFFHITGDI